MEKNMKEEIWKSIEGYENYQISNLGRVRSLKFGKTKVLKPGKNSRGYLSVVLYKNRKMKSFKVHRLVAQAFIPNPQNLPQVNHKDENKLNNTVENLEFCTNEYNHNYGTRNERAGKAISKAQMNHPKRSKTVLQFSKSGEFLKEYPSTHEVERETGISQSAISACCLGKLKSAGGFIWKYKESNFQ